MSTISNTEFNKLLNNISSATPILFFPLRLETHFRTGARGDELCVRIFPDEIFVDYLIESLTADEINDAKRFWIQWYIASGNKEREYEAWQVLCAKYPVYRAAWLVRQLRPANIGSYKEKENIFNTRPFIKISEIQENIDYIFSALSNNRIVTCDKIKIEQCLREIEEHIKSYNDIVDYL